MVVDSGVTLTVEPGVTVKFDSGKVLEVEGTLVARGTSGNKVTFTSSAVSPAAGDWGYIKFKDSSPDASFDGSGDYISGSILEQCVVHAAVEVTELGKFSISFLFFSLFFLQFA